MTDRWIEEFRRQAVPVLVDKFKAGRIILFGSRVRGNASEDSDIDAIVISDEFKKIPFLKRSPLLLKALRFNKHIDFLCYDPEQFERIKQSSSILMDALENGMVVV